MVIVVDNNPDGGAEWFTQAISRLGQSRRVQAHGRSIHYLTWGHDKNSPVLLFVHGYRAHAQWWSFITPFFAEEYRVAALDLSGMGDSDRCAEYSAAGFAEDIIAVLGDMGAQGAILVGHSFGGGRALRAAADAPDLIDRVIVVDSFIQFPNRPTLEGVQLRGVNAAYQNFEEAYRRFRLTPPQPCSIPQILGHIARTSLRNVIGGWEWKFDRNLPAIILDAAEAELFSTIRARVDVIFGQHSSVVDAPLAEQTAKLFDPHRQAIEIPEGYHHVMVSQPLALVTALRALLIGGKG